MSPSSPGLLTPAIDTQAACVAACVRASTVCSVTADACLDEDGVAEFRGSIRLLLDCVDVLTATATVLSRHFGALPTPVGTLLSACADLSTSCAEDLTHAAPVDHGRRCAAECRRAADACEALLRGIDPTSPHAGTRERR